MRYNRSHPINILENTSKYLGLLLIPLLRALLTSPAGLQTWVSGAWLDILVILLILGIGTYQWYSYVFCYDEFGLHIKKGIIIKKTRFLAFINLSSISMQEPFLLRPIKAVRLNFDTDGGGVSRSDFKITVKLNTALSLVEIAKTPFSTKNQLKKSYIPNNFYIALYSLINSDTLTGVIYLSISVNKLGDIFGEEFSDKLIISFSQLSKIISFGLPPLAAFIAWFIIGCYALAFLISLIKHLKFKTFRQGDIINITAGLLSKKTHTLIVSRVNFLTLRQSILTRLLGFYSVEIECTGYGKFKNEKSVIFPSGSGEQILANIKMLLPKLDIVKKQIKPKRNTFTRFLFIPIISIIGVVLAFLVAYHFAVSFRTSLIMLFVITIIPFIWWLIVRGIAFSYSGIGMNESVYTLYYTYAYQFITCSIPKEKVVKIVVYQSLLQKRKRCCNVIFYCYGESKKTHRVLNLPLEQVQSLLSSDN